MSDNTLNPLTWGNWCGAGYSAGHYSLSFLALTKAERDVGGTNEFDASVPKAHDLAYDGAQQTLITGLAGLGANATDADYLAVFTTYLTSISEADKAYIDNSTNFFPESAWGTVLGVLIADVTFGATQDVANTLAAGLIDANGNATALGQEWIASAKQTNWTSLKSQMDAYTAAANKEVPDEAQIAELKSTVEDSIKASSFLDTLSDPIELAADAVVINPALIGEVAAALPFVALFAGGGTVAAAVEEIVSRLGDVVAGVADLVAEAVDSASDLLGAAVDGMTALFEDGICTAVVDPATNNGIEAIEWTPVSDTSGTTTSGWEITQVTFEVPGTGTGDASTLAVLVAGHGDAFVAAVEAGTITLGTDAAGNAVVTSTAGGTVAQGGSYSIATPADGSGSFLVTYDAGGNPTGATEVDVTPFGTGGTQAVEPIDGGAGLLVKGGAVVGNIEEGSDYAVYRPSDGAAVFATRDADGNDLSSQTVVGQTTGANGGTEYRFANGLGVVVDDGDISATVHYGEGYAVTTPVDGGAALLTTYDAAGNAVSTAIQSTTVSDGITEYKGENGTGVELAADGKLYATVTYGDDYSLAALADGSGSVLRVDTANGTVAMDVSPSNELQGTPSSFDDVLDVDYALGQAYDAGVLSSVLYDNYNDWASSYLLSLGSTITYSGGGLTYDPIGAFYESRSAADDPAASIAASTPALLGADGKGLTAAALAALDANGDGVLSGAELSGLAAWVDANENGIAETGEIKSLADAGIASIRDTDYGFYTSGNSVAAAVLAAPAASSPLAEPAKRADPAGLALPADPSEPGIPGRLDYTQGVPDSNFRGLRDNDNVYIIPGGYIAWSASQIKIDYNNQSYLIGTDGNDSFDIGYYAAYDGSYFNLSQITHFLGGGGDDTVGGSTRDDSIWGGTGNDILLGYAGNDKLYGEDGNDQLQGNAGNDYLDGGTGADTLFGQVGNDVLSGGDGNDVLVGFTASNESQQSLNAGETDDDWLYGGAGADVLDGGPGNDYLDGGADNDSLYGGTGNDTLLGGSGDDQLQGGDGNDLLAGESGADTLYGQAGDDVLWGGDGIDTLYGGAGNDTLWGGADNDLMFGEDGNDILQGGAGSDELQGNAGNDTLFGGAGTDTLFGQVGNDVLSGGDGDDVLMGFTPSNDSKQTLSAGETDNDTLFGGAGADYLNGGLGDDILDGGADNDGLYGGAGNDTLLGAAGADTLFGQVGNDVLSGGDGDDGIMGFTAIDDAKQTLSAGETDNDTLFGDGGNDTLWGGLGDDLLDGGADNDLLFGGAGTDTLWGGTGNDELQGEAGNDLLVGDAGDDRMFGQVGNDTLWGGDGADVLVGFTASNETKQSLSTGETDNDTLLGGAGGDNLFGGLGDDLLDGGDDNDLLLGGDGADTLLGGNGADELQGGAGNDSLIGGAGNDHMFGQVGNDTLWGGDGDDVMMGFTASNETKQSLAAGETDNDTLDGGAGNDLMIGGLGDDILMGGAGADELQGGAGNDSAYGGDGADRLFGGVGNDVLYGGDGNDIILGFTASNETKQSLSAGETDNDWLYGGAGNDTLLGGLGDDYLDGGAGADIMEGGAGDDIYIVNSVNDNILEQAGEGYDTVISSANYILNSGIEELRLLEGYDINGTGNKLDNLIIGNSSDNIIDGVTGADTMIGGAGNDTYYVDNIGDQTVEKAGEGTDTVQSSISTTLASNVEDLILLDFSKPEQGLVDGEAVLVYGYPKRNELDYTQGDAVTDFWGTCALTSIANLLTQADQPATEGDVVQLAIDNGWAVTDPSLPAYERGGSNYIEQQEILDSYGIRNDLIAGYNEDGIANLIRSGRGVIIAVNAGLLWDDAAYVDNGGVNHVVTITGAVYSEADGSLLGFYIADSGRHLVSDMTRFVGIDTFRAAANVSNAYAIYTTEAIKLWDENIDGTGNELDNTLVGNRGDNALFGVAGNDLLEGGAGADTLNGGDGNDTATYAGSSSGVTVNLATGIGSGGDAEGDVLTAIENLSGSNFADSLTGDSGANRLSGGAGNDTLAGGGGTDTYVFAAGGGRDVIVNGGAGDGVDGSLALGDGLTSTSLWFSRSGNDLVVQRLGSDDQITVKNWYDTSVTGAQLAEIDSADGLKLDSQLDGLVQAMATYSAANPGFDPTATANATITDSGVLAVAKAAWHQ